MLFLYFHTVCFQNLLFTVIQGIQSFVTSGRFTLAIYEWSRLRGPPIEQLWLAEVDRSSFVQTSSFNPFIVSASSQVGLEITSVGKCEVQNVNWASDLSPESLTLIIENTTKTALYSLSEDDRIVTGGMAVEQSLVIEVTKVCEQELDSIQEGDPLHCSEDPSTFDFKVSLYLPYYADTHGLSGIMEDQLNNITSFQEAEYPISSCSLGDIEVFSFAQYYPDWFAFKSCINDGKKM